MLDRARRGTLPGTVGAGATFADAAAEFVRYVEHDRGRKPGTVRGYRSVINTHPLPALGELAVEAVTTPVIERWSRARKVYGGGRWPPAGRAWRWWSPSLTGWRLAV